MITTNRNHKDAFFKMVFGEHPENALALYNALNGTSYTNPEDLEIMTIKEALYVGVKNDVAFLFDDSINLCEHQSTLNENMPLRGLGYFSELYTDFIAKLPGGNKSIYRRRMIRIPRPGYYVFYNGEKMTEERFELRLSNAYEGDGDLEIVCHMININKGNNKDLLDSCKPLNDYSEVIHRIRANRKEGLDDEAAVKTAIESCIGDKIMTEILEKEKNRAVSLLIRGLTEEEAKELHEEELAEEREIARREGRAEGLAEGREEGHAEGLAEGLAEGRAEGLAEGREEGHAEGLAEGRAEGREEGREEVIKELLNGETSLEELKKELIIRE